LTNICNWHFGEVIRSEPSTTLDIALDCVDVWKVFGLGSSRLRQVSENQDPEQLLRSWGITAAVREISLAVRKGEKFCIMGLSGSGKSTLVRCMIELRRHAISMVFQDFALLPHLTVMENIAVPFAGSWRAIVGALFLIMSLCSSAVIRKVEARMGRRVFHGNVAAR
jgi:ABC-type branched-subunit amino acid transport system ATPase component